VVLEPFPFSCLIALSLDSLHRAAWLTCAGSASPPANPPLVMQRMTGCFFPFRCWFGFGSAWSFSGGFCWLRGFGHGCSLAGILLFSLRCRSCSLLRRRSFGLPSGRLCSSGPWPWPRPRLDLRRFVPLFISHSFHLFQSLTRWQPMKHLIAADSVLIWVADSESAASAVRQPNSKFRVSDAPAPLRSTTFSVCL